MSFTMQSSRRFYSAAAGWIIKETGKRDINDIRRMGNGRVLLTVCTMIGALIDGGCSGACSVQQRMDDLQQRFSNPLHSSGGGRSAGINSDGGLYPAVCWFAFLYPRGRNTNKRKSAAFSESGNWCSGCFDGNRGHFSGAYCSTMLPTKFL